MRASRTRVSSRSGWWIAPVKGTSSISRRACSGTLLRWMHSNSGTGFGRMLMTFEGWQFKLEIFDPSEDP